MRTSLYRALFVAAVFFICYTLLKYPRLEAAFIAGLFTWIWEPLFTEKNPNT